MLLELSFHSLAANSLALGKKADFEVINVC
jgi:hypothetical protein